MTRIVRFYLFFLLIATLSAHEVIRYGYDDAGRLISADYGNGNVINYTYDTAGNLLRREVTAGSRLVSVSSASFTGGQALAASLISAGFGPGLAAGTAVAGAPPLPTELLGTRIEITDSNGDVRLAPLFFVSAGQVNYLVPEGTALGLARVRVVSGAGGEILGIIRIDAVAPSLYTANKQGTGVAAAFFLRVNPDNSRTQKLIYDPNTLAAVPIDVSPEAGQVFLLLFGTGFRNFQSGVAATVGGQSVPTLDALPQGEFAGLDQINIGPLPAGLAGSGNVNIILTADGKLANTVTVTIK